MRSSIAASRGNANMYANDSRRPARGGGGNRSGNTTLTSTSIISAINPTTTISGYQQNGRGIGGDGGSNIQVVVRCRGRNDREIKAKSQVVVDTSSTSKTEISVKITNDASSLSSSTASSSVKTYSVDRVFGPEADQSMIFDEIAAPIVDDLLNGMNCTIFAYGQTGTGKTYTMSGDDSTKFDACAHEAGIIPRVLFKLFNTISSKGYDHAVSCSFVELYNEELKDLLDDDDNKRLRLFDDSNSSSGGSSSSTSSKKFMPTAGSSGNGVTLNGLSDSHITSAISGLKVLQDGLRKRQVAATRMNDYSSRSHTIFCINVGIDKEGSGEFITKGKINLVDLAGSENIGKSGAENKRAREAGMINQSLLTLGRVINSLVDKSPHIPYRESKLTRLLQDSLGGHTKTCIIATISPALVNVEETLSTLEYASRAKNIKNKPQLNNPVSKRTLLVDFNNEMEKLRLDLIATRKKNGIYLDNDHYNEITTDRESQKLLLSDQQRRLETVDKQLKVAREQLDSTKYELLQKTRELKSTSVSLNETLQSLTVTQKSLKTTKDALNHETLLRKAHANTEDELQSIGGVLINTLDQTIKDVNILHDKIQASREVENATKNIVDDSTETIVDNIKILSGKIDEYGGKQMEIADFFCRNVLQLVDEECSRLTDTSSFLNDSLTNVDTLKDGLIRSTSKSEGYTKQLTDHVMKIKANLISGLQDGLLNELRKSMEAFNVSLSQELKEFKSQIQCPLDELSNDFESISDLHKVELATQFQNLESLRHVIEKVSYEVSQNYEQNLKKLNARLIEERKQSADDQKKLISNISVLLENYTADTDSRFRKAINSATDELMTDSIQKLQVRTGEFNGTINDITDNNTRFHENMITKQQQLYGRSKKILEQVSSGSDRIELVTAQLKSDSESAIQTGLISVHSQISNLDRFLLDSTENSQLYHQAVNKGVTDLYDSVQHAFTYLDSHLGNLRTNIKLLGENQDTKALAGRLTDIWNSVANESNNSIRRILNQIDELRRGVDENQNPSTGHTPKRRKIEFARVLPNTQSVQALSSNNANNNENLDITIGYIEEENSREVETKLTRPPLGDVTQDDNLLPNAMAVDSENVIIKRDRGKPTSSIIDSVIPSKRSVTRTIPVTRQRSNRLREKN